MEPLYSNTLWVRFVYEYSEIVSECRVNFNIRHATLNFGDVDCTSCMHACKKMHGRIIYCRLLIIEVLIGYYYDIVLITAVNCKLDII